MFGDPPLPSQLTPSTKISQLELVCSTALPMRSAARRQSLAVSPQPQQEPVPVGSVPSACGSLTRSAPPPGGLFPYRDASLCQSAISLASVPAPLYHSAVCP